MEKTVLISLPIEDLQTVIIDCVNSCLKNSKQVHSEQSKQDDLLTVEEAATFLHLAKQTIYERTAAGTIPCMKQGKRLYFSKKELTDYIAQGKRLTASEAAAQASNYLSNK